MFNRRLTIILGFSIFIIILFDAFQQKFYIDTFNLNPEGSSFIYILKSHLLRWFIWLIESIPYAIVANTIFKSKIENISNKKLFFLFVCVIISIQIMFITIALISMALFNSEISYSIFSEWFLFIFYQKTVSFSLASALLVLLIYNNSRKQVINAQWIEIKKLQEKAKLIPTSQEGQIISIKIGDRLKVIPLNEIHWIESDDYCVKIHTKERAYSLRKTLKSLEKELSEYRFIRVHRKALLNLSFIDYANFALSKVKLLDKTEIPLSKSGAQLLRNIIG